MGFIDSFADVMAMETGFLQYAMELLRTEYAADGKRLGIAIPNVERIPCVRFDEVKGLAAEKYGYQIRDPYDLEPEEEHAIGRYAKEEWGSDFVFVTHYPSKKRPWTTPQTPGTPCPLTCCSGAWKSPPAASGSTATPSR